MSPCLASRFRLLDRGEAAIHCVRMPSMRNTDPQDAGITQRNASGAKAAFEEDRLILEAVHQGM